MVLLIHLDPTYFKRGVSCRGYIVDNLNFVQNCQMIPVNYCDMYLVEINCGKDPLKTS